MRFKLSNIPLKVPGNLRQFPGMLYRNSAPVDYSEEDSSLAFEGTLDFLTYYGLLSASKWKRYTVAEKAFLHIELAGDGCDIQFVGIPEDVVDGSDATRYSHAIPGGSIPPVEGMPIGRIFRFDGSSEYLPLNFEAPIDGMLIVGFRITSDGATSIRNAFWETEVDEGDIRDVKIAVVTTTYRNEGYILPNIDLIKNEVIGSEEPVSGKLKLFVIDNGRTLDNGGLSDGDVSIFPNPNIGGSGGFARGMIEAVESEEGFTHVILMDDDVRVFPESFIRTYNLLSLVNDDYADAFINGAMLQMENPNVQFEDVSNVVGSGVYKSLKCALSMEFLDDVAVNEAIDVEVPRAYGAWWYSCIPVSAIEKNGLPLPLFVRCDDVEYGLRCKPTYMTMSGICVWHGMFDDRFRASVDGYQYMRNFPIAASTSSDISLIPHFLRAVRTILLYIRSLDYTTAEQIIEGLEDYMAGPQVIMEPRGEEILKRNNAECEKLLPLGEAIASASEEHPELSEILEGFEPDMRMLRTDVPQIYNKVLRLFRSLPYDKHILPDFLLSERPGTAHHGTASSLPGTDQIARKVIVACNRAGTQAHVRVMDKAREAGIRNRMLRVVADFISNGRVRRQEYADAFPTMASIGFWKEYIRKADA